MVLRALKNLIENSLHRRGEEPADREHAIRLATAALLVEMEGADFERLEGERAVTRELLSRHFDLDDTETGMLLDTAGDRAHTAVSLHEFTRLLHEELSEKEKHTIIEMLWEVGFADGHLDKHEEHLVRKIAGLLYVRDNDLMRLKWKVQQRLGR